MQENLRALGGLDFSEDIRQFFENIMFLLFVFYLDLADGVQVVRTIHHLFKMFLLLMEVVDLRVDVSRTTIFFLSLNRLQLVLDGQTSIHFVLFDPDEVVVLLLLVDSFHVFVKIIVNILVPIACVESLQEKLMIIFLGILL